MDGPRQRIRGDQAETAATARGGSGQGLCWASRPRHGVPWMLRSAASSSHRDLHGRPVINLVGFPFLSVINPFKASLRFDFGQSLPPAARPNRCESGGRRSSPWQAREGASDAIAKLVLESRLT